MMIPTDFCLIGFGSIVNANLHQKIEFTKRHEPIFHRKCRIPNFVFIILQNITRGYLSYEIFYYICSQFAKIQ